MNVWTSIQSLGGDAPDTWRAGTYMLSVTELETAHSSVSSGEGSGTSAVGGTTDYTASNKVSHLDYQTFAATSYQAEDTHGGEWSSVSQCNYTPSTYTEYVPSASGPPTSAASTATITSNYTISGHTSSHDHGTSRGITGDTTAQSDYMEATLRIVNGVTDPVVSDSNGNPLPTHTHRDTTFTHHGASEFIASFQEAVDTWTTKTVTNGTFENWSVWTTSSWSFPVSTNPTQTKTSSSSWTLTPSITQATSATTETIESSVTHAADHTTVHLSVKTNTAGVTYAVPVTTETLTGHVYTQKIDTVAMLRGGRNDTDFNLGDMLWHFTLSALGDAASTTGRFTDLFGSTAAATVTLSDFGKFRTNSIAITDITISRDTATATTSIVTGTGTATGTAATATTVWHTSKNGARWDEYDTYNTTHQTGTGTNTGSEAITAISGAASNSSTDTYSFSIGNVGTTVSTWEVSSSTYTTTIFTHTSQVTGYDTNNSWTSSTETAQFNSSSFTESRLALWASTITTMELVMRSTTADTILINSQATHADGTDVAYFHLGMVSTETTRVYDVETTTSRSLYASEFQNEADQYTTVSSYTLPGGGNGVTYGVSEAQGITHHTKYRALPQIRTTPDGLNPYQFLDGQVLDVARFSVLPNGYAGCGGTFAVSALAVHSTVEVGLVSGGAFSGQSLDFAALPTVSAYPGVTLFPVDPGLTFNVPGAERASYVSRLDSIGTATVAATWTSTTTAATSSGTASQVTRMFATYTVAAASPIAGTFFSDEPLSIHAENSFQLIGGYAVGDNHLGNPYTVFARSGFAQWTEYSAGQSTASAVSSTSNSNGTVSFTVPGNHAIAFQIEPVFTARWTGGGEIPHYFSSTPHVPFE